jgi:ribosomal protein S18 acetylase RimI-like enzyme
MDEITISSVSRDAFPAIWSILESTVRDGLVYALDRDMTFDAAENYWFAPSHRVFAAKQGGEIVGSYFLRPNAHGGGAHVANAGFVTAPAHRSRGIARAMGEHCVVQARALGFRAIQFNFVIAANVRAVNLWRSLGFGIVGTLPAAFILPDGSSSDVYVMFKVV